MTTAFAYLTSRNMRFAAVLIAAMLLMSDCIWEGTP